MKSKNFADKRVVVGFLLVFMTLIVIVYRQRQKASYGSYISFASRFVSFNGEFSQLMDNRRKTVSIICKENRQELHWSQTELKMHMKQKYIWDLSHHLVFCPVSKVASTSWVLNFLSLAGITKDDLPRILKERSEDMVKGREKNWAGKTGGKGLHSLAYQLYPAPNAESVETLIQLQQNLTVFMLVSIFSNKHIGKLSCLFRYVILLSG